MENLFFAQPLLADFYCKISCQRDIEIYLILFFIWYMVNCDGKVISTVDCNTFLESSTKVG